MYFPEPSKIIKDPLERRWSKVFTIWKVRADHFLPNLTDNADSKPSHEKSIGSHRIQIECVLWKDGTQVCKKNIPEVDGIFFLVRNSMQLWYLGWKILFFLITVFSTPQVPFPMRDQVLDAVTA